MNLKQKRRKLFLGCLTTSLFLHALAIVFVQRYSLWFSSPQQAGEPSEWLSLVDKKERDQILKAAFNPVSSGKKEPSPSQKPHPESIAPVVLRSPMQLPEPENVAPFHTPFSFPIHDFLVSQPVLPTFSVPSASFNLLDHLPKDLIVSVPAEQHRTRFLPLPNPSSLTLSAPAPAPQEEAPPALITYSASLDLPLTEAPHAAQAPAMIPVPHLPKIPTLAELETSSYSDAFDADLVFIPKEEGNGYLFALTLIPRPDLELPKIRQHFTFLIDRSNSIQQGRLSATKSALYKALEELSPEDTFNIIAFDSKMEKMSPNSLSCTERSYAVAEEFLEKIQLGSFFSSTDLYKPLFLTVPGEVQNDEIHTAILLTDGETLVKKTAQRALLYNWTQFNAGKVSLYAISLNGDPHMATLETAAVFNKGKLSNAPTHRGLKRKLLKLIRTIRNPIGKNLVCKAISRSPQAKIHLFPPSKQTPHLYLDQPYVILGEADTLDDFILFVQGRLKDRWLNIKKTISFLNARKGGKSLKQEWALQRAYALYERYAIDDNPQHLTEAERLLEPFDYPVAFR